MNPVGAYVRDHIILGSTLVIPIRVLWRDYLAYCKLWGFEPGDAGDFVVYITLSEGVTIRKGGRGRLHRCFEGIGTRGVIAGILSTMDEAA